MAQGSLLVLSLPKSLLMERFCAPPAPFLSLNTSDEISSMNEKNQALYVRPQEHVIDILLVGSKAGQVAHLNFP